MNANRSIDFFDRQFRRQALDRQHQLNPFEQAALPHLSERVLDYGCGMGNLAFAAAARGCTVLALDASPAAVSHIQQRASSESAPVEALLADLRDYEIQGEFDAVVSIGLLMFLDCPDASRRLADLQSHVREGGIAVVNVLVQGTTYMDMFDPVHYCLFARGELESRFAGWDILLSQASEFEAPGGTVKRFETLIARKAQART